MTRLAAFLRRLDDWWARPHPSSLCFVLARVLPPGSPVRSGRVWQFRHCPPGHTPHYCKRGHAMSDEHTTWLAEEDDGTVTAMCHSCNWQGTERVSNRDQAGQEAELHTATKAGRTWPCPASETHVEPEHEGATLAVCPYCGLTVDVRPSYVSRREWRYEQHLMILDPDVYNVPVGDVDGVVLEGNDYTLAEWWETTKAAVDGGKDAVRRLNEQARIRAMSEEYRGQRGKAS